MSASIPPERRGFDISAFLARLRERGCPLGEPFHYFESVSSTNDMAREAARHGALAGACFFAEEQSAGRGRYGRAWYSPDAAGLWVSLLIDVKRVQSSPLITLLVGAALRRALEKHVLNAIKHSGVLKVKWPNDIEVAGKKLAGILVEAELNSPLLVVGFGVNTSGHFGPELNHAVALNQCGNTVSREALLVDILSEIAVGLTSLERDGLAPLVSELRGVDALLGQSIAVGELQGVGCGIDEQGRLLLEADGALHAVSSGSVERLNA